MFTPVYSYRGTALVVSLRRSLFVPSTPTPSYLYSAVNIVPTSHYSMHADLAGSLIGSL